MRVLSFYLSALSLPRLLTMLSFTVVAGVSNALLLITVNSYLHGRSAFAPSVAWFGSALFAYAVSTKIFGTLMQRATVKLIYDTRRRVLDRVLKARFGAFEQLSSEEITSCITQDTIVVGNAAAPLINGVSALITLLVCLGYIYYLSPGSLLFLFLGMAAGSLLYWLQVVQAQKLWAQARNEFQRFMGYVEDLLRGYKELKVSRARREDFYYNDLLEAMDLQRRHRILGGEKFVNARIVGDLFIFLIIGSLVFFFAGFVGTPPENRVSLVVTLLYMLGPVLFIISSFSVLTDTGIAVKRTTDLLDKLSRVDEPGGAVAEREPTPTPEWDSLVLSGLLFEHADEAHGTFRVGPISTVVNRGDLIFISGANGSGKTTLVKLLLGLYEPMGGQIEFQKRGQPVLSSADGDAYMSMFAPVFYDFHLFERLYGLPGPVGEEAGAAHVERMKLGHKVRIVDNRFTTRRLSYGQQKRLALVAASFDDRPVFVFDEFAAEQDPEFKQYIYREIFPGLKREGKTVIAITHDDHYFDLCDRLFRMEDGRLEEVARDAYARDFRALSR